MERYYSGRVFHELLLRTPKKSYTCIKEGSKGNAGAFYRALVEGKITGKDFVRESIRKKNCSRIVHGFSVHDVFGFLVRSEFLEIPKSMLTHYLDLIADRIIMEGGVISSSQLFLDTQRKEVTNV